MVHHVTGLLGERAFLEGVAGTWSSRVFDLAAGIALLPLPEETFDTPIPIGRSDCDLFQHLTPSLTTVLAEASKGGQFIYFETEYFGGDGGQGAVLYRNGEPIFGPIWDRVGPINSALAIFGIKVTAPKLDEFATVGLDRLRTTQAWIENC